MKEYERQETERRFLPLAPVYARIDGRSFSRFTQGMDRPYDPALSRCMIEVTRHLVSETGALLGYTQSDEISLVWQMPDYKSQMLFDGKAQKLVSVLASMTAIKFGLLAQAHWPERVAKLLPCFDCRVFSLPNREEAANAILWREKDATKNSISMAARSVYSHNALHNQGAADMQEMLFQKGINWNDYPSFFKRGTFLQRRKVYKVLDGAVLAKIPAKHRPDGPIERWEIVELLMPPFTQVTNRAAVVFDGADPAVTVA